jgi:plasmid stabilization system protein ParE
MPRVFKRAAARRDLVQHYVYLAENAGDAVADRFLACAETSFVELSEHPQMGAVLPLWAKATICRLNSGVYRVLLDAISNTSMTNIGVSTKGRAFLAWCRGREIDMAADDDPRR